MQTAQIIRRLIEIADFEGEEFQRRAGQRESRGGCILMTAIGCEVLARFNIEANPLPVDVAAYNAAHMAWVDSGSPQPYPPAALSVDTRLMPDDLPSGESDGFRGHVVVHIPDDEVLLDLDLRQFARPARNIRLPGAQGFQWPRGSTSNWFSFASGAEVFIRERPDLVPYIGPLPKVCAQFASEIVPRIRGSR